MVRTLPWIEEEVLGNPQKPGTDADDLKEINAGLTADDLQKRAELEEAPMRAELKYLEKRYTTKGTEYICEPKEDEDVPDQKFNWYEKYALCVSGRQRLFPPGPAGLNPPS